LSLIPKQFNQGDPIDVTVLNQIIVAINTLATQVAQIYKLPAPQASITVNNNGTTTTQDATTGGTVTTTTIPMSIQVNTNGYVDFNSSFVKTQVTLSKADVDKAAGKTVKDYKIVGISSSQPKFVSKGTTTQIPATGIDISTSVYGTGKSWSWWLTKNGLATYSAGKNAPATTDPSANRRIYFTWRLDVEVSY
jgi:hypothetical protein